VEEAKLAITHQLVLDNKRIKKKVNNIKAF